MNHQIRGLLSSCQAVLLGVIVGFGLDASASEGETHAGAAGSPAALGADAPKIILKRTDAGVAVSVDGKPFTEYLIESNNKPILWPIIGPTGKRMTRDYPMVEAPAGKKPDHVHHRSLWFTHGDVGGISFWEERKPPLPRIKHLEFVRVEDGPPATIVARNAWLAANGDEVCRDERTLRFGASIQARWIDFDITLTAGDKPVTFGDTKEGTLGLRVADSLRVKGGKGTIVNSNGQRDDEAWAKRADWVDYHGPVDDETVGVAIFNHPSSFRYPTYWHVRTYGLFAANPFGVKDFTGKEGGAYTLPAGQSFTLKYRIYMHAGDERAGKVAEAYGAYAKTGPEAR